MKFTDNEVMELSSLVLNASDHDVAWYDIGSRRHIDLEKIAIQTDVSNINDIEVKPDYSSQPRSLLAKLFNLPGYTLKIKNPKRVPAHIDAGRETAIIYAIVSYNAGNVERAAIYFSPMYAFVDPKYKQLVQSKGFRHEIPERLYKHEIILK